MGKGNMKAGDGVTKALVAIVVVCLIGVIGVLGYMVFKKPVSYTAIYFNAESDLPDYLTMLKNVTGANELEVGKAYNVVFTVESHEKTATEYVYEVRSDILSEKKTITLSPGDSEKVALTIKPAEKDKWTLVSEDKKRFDDKIDITKDSWLAGKKEFMFVLRDGVPALIEENYHLPISFNVSGIGEVFHTNMSIKELREKPFYKNYTTEKGSTFELEKEVGVVKLYADADKLYFSNDVTIQKHISEEKAFAIRLIEGAGYEVNETTGIQKFPQISFKYRIK